MLECPRRLIDLRASMLVAGAYATVGPQRPFVERSVHGGGEAARPHGEDLPRREAGGGNHRLERRELGEPRDAVAYRRGHVRERQEQLTAGMQPTGRIAEARGRGPPIIEHIQTEYRLRRTPQAPRE